MPGRKVIPPIIMNSSPYGADDDDRSHPSSSWGEITVLREAERNGIRGVRQQAGQTTAVTISNTGYKITSVGANVANPPGVFGRFSQFGAGLPDEHVMFDGDGPDVLQEVSLLFVGNGDVYKYRHKVTGDVYAVKKVNLPYGDNDQDIQTRVNIMRELVILHTVKSPYIVSFHGCFSQDHHVCLVMEYMDAGSLDSLLEKVGALPEVVLANVALSVVKALTYMRTIHNAIHRDIKPANILMSRDGQSKLCDFGISNFMEGSLVFTRNGTGCYHSPERACGDGSYGTRADVWALGISLVELATGRHPFSDNAGPNQWIAFRYLSFGTPPKLPRNMGVSDEFCNFVGRCLDPVEKKRPRPFELVDDEWLLFMCGTDYDVGTWVRGVLDGSCDRVHVDQSVLDLVLSPLPDHTLPEVGTDAGNVDRTGGEGQTPAGDDMQWDVSYFDGYTRDTMAASSFVSTSNIPSPSPSGRSDMFIESDRQADVQVMDFINDSPPGYSSTHSWRISWFPSGEHCRVCEVQLRSLGGSQCRGLRCTVCELVVHGQCKSGSPACDNAG